MNPLTPADCDLRDFQFMPLDVVRLRDSDLATTATGEEAFAAVLLWCASWHQVPAASLPDDDRLLSQFAGYGRAVREWTRVKDGAMRGWAKADDGRWYHPVVAEKAAEAWNAKLQQRWRTECARIKKAAQRTDSRPDYPTFEEWLLSRGTTPARPEGQNENVPGDKPPVSPICPPGQGIQGTGIGTGTGTGNKDQELPPDGGGEVGKPTPPPADLAKRQQERLRQVAEDARLAFNAALGKPHGLLASVRLLTPDRIGQVKRCLTVARAICQAEYGAERISPHFWTDYFASAAADEFHSGRQVGGRGHENWQPDFEYLTRPATMSKLFDKAMADVPQNEAQA